MIRGDKCPLRLAKVVAHLKSIASEKARQELTRYGIPNEKAYGIPMGVMKKYAKSLGKNTALAEALWETGWYEPRSVAVFVADPRDFPGSLMDAWANDFDSWAICDTACMHLFDQTPYAWDKVRAWIPVSREFVRRAGFAMIWALTVHDKGAHQEKFVEALRLIETAEADDRPLVKKAANMALRSIGKRSIALNHAAIETARRMSQSEHKSHAWIGRHALRELQGEKVQARLAKKPK